MGVGMGVLSRIFCRAGSGAERGHPVWVWVSVYFRGNRFYYGGRTVPALFFGSGRRVDFDELPVVAPSS